MSKISLISTSLCALFGLVFLALAWLGWEPAQAQMSGDMRSQFTALMQVCRADYARLCSGVQPGGGRILACLETQANALSPACAQAMAKAQALKDQAAGALPK